MSSDYLSKTSCTIYPLCCSFHKTHKPSIFLYSDMWYRHSIKNLGVDFSFFFFFANTISVSMCWVSLSICMVKSYSAPTWDEKDLSSVYFQTSSTAVLVDPKDPSPFVRGVISKPIFVGCTYEAFFYWNRPVSSQRRWFRGLEGGSCKTPTLVLFCVLSGVLVVIRPAFWKQL